jgi:hypothetical protein
MTIGPRVGDVIKLTVDKLWMLAFVAIQYAFYLGLNLLEKFVDFSATALKVAYDTYVWTDLNLLEFVNALLAFYAAYKTVVASHQFLVLSKEYFTFIYLYVYGHQITYPKTEFLAWRNYIGTEDVKEEGAFANVKFKNEHDVTPKGVVQVFEKFGDEMSFAGHATYVDGKYVTVWHVIRPAFENNGRLLVGTLESGKALEVKVDVDSIRKDIDHAELIVGNTASVLGVKMRKSAFPKGNMVTIYTFNPDLKKYYSSTVYCDQYNPESGFSEYVLLSKSDTKGGDSGLPIEQAGNVIGKHKGGCERLRRNVHLINAPILGKQIEQLAMKKQQIFVQDGIRDETPWSVTDQADIERAKAILEEEQRVADLKRRGAYVDEQGFRISKPKFKNKAWADIEDESDVETMLAEIKKCRLRLVELIAHANGRASVLAAADKITRELDALEQLQSSLVMDESIHDSEVKITAPRESAIQVSRALSTQKETIVTEKKPSPSPSGMSRKKQDMSGLKEPVATMSKSLEQHLLEDLEATLTGQLEPSPTRNAVNGSDLAASQKVSDTSSSNNTQATSSGRKRKSRSRKSRGSVVKQEQQTKTLQKQ